MFALRIALAARQQRLPIFRFPCIQMSSMLKNARKNQYLTPANTVTPSFESRSESKRPKPEDVPVTNTAALRGVSPLLHRQQQLRAVS